MQIGLDTTGMVASKSNLATCRNAVFARRGRPFQNPRYQTYFYGSPAKDDGPPHQAFELRSDFDESMLTAMDHTALRQIRAASRQREQAMTKVAKRLPAKPSMSPEVATVDPSPTEATARLSPKPRPEAITPKPKPRGTGCRSSSKQRAPGRSCRHECARSPPDQHTPSGLIVKRRQY